MSYLYWPPWLLLTSLGIPKHSLETTLLIYIYHEFALKETNRQISVLVQRGVSPNNYLEISTRDAQHLFPEKEKQYSKSSNCCFHKKKRENSGLGQKPIPTRSPKFPLLTTVHALNHQSMYKMIMFINQY